MDDEVLEVLEGCRRLVREDIEHGRDHRPCESGARAQLARAVYATLTGECLDCIMVLDHHCIDVGVIKLRAERSPITMMVVDKFEKNDNFSDVWPT